MVAGDGDVGAGDDDAALDVLILGAFLLAYHADPAPGGIARVVLLCTPAFYGFVLGVASLPIPLLRMYFYVEVLRALMLCFVCVRLCRGRAGGMIGVVMVVAAAFYAQLRIMASPFVYEHDVVTLLFRTPLFG